MNNSLNNKKIILIIGGGIAAYKSLDLIRTLKKEGCEVKVVLTKSGKKFVTPLSIVSLSQNKVYEDIFDHEKESEMVWVKIKNARIVYNIGVIYMPQENNKTKGQLQKIYASTL